MASQPDDELPQINEMLIQLDLLLGRVFDHKPTWKPTPEESAFMEDVANRTGPHLPPQALKSTTVAVAFLLAAKSSLELMARHIVGDGAEEQPRPGPS
jgi:hypothetical protein